MKITKKILKDAADKLKEDGGPILGFSFSDPEGPGIGVTYDYVDKVGPELLGHLARFINEVVDARKP